MKYFFSTHDRNPHFAGRERILADLGVALDTGRPAALVGPEGAGKSQIADEYARLHVEDYDFRFWVRACDPITLISEYADLAESLDIPYNEEADLNEAADSVRIWLEQNGRWLLIFDDASTPSDLEEYLPRGGSGHVIITSPYPGWDDVAASISVGTFERSEGALFLRSRTGQEDVAASEALSEALEDLPLALELAGAYIKWTGISLSRYLAAYQDRTSAAPVQSAPGVSNAVATILEISVEQVQAVSQEGIDALNLAAFLAAGDLPFDILIEAGQLLQEAVDPGLEALSKRGLIRSGEGPFSVHPLVQAHSFHRLGEEDRKVWAESSAGAVGAAFSAYLENLDTWPKCVRLLSHALKASEHAQDLEAGSEDASLLLNQMGLYLHRRGYFAGAKQVLERQLAIDEKLYGSDHPEVATDLNNLGSVLRLLGDLEGAKKSLERALAIEEGSEAVDPLKIATRANNLGTVLRALGDLEGAKQNFERALAIDERSYGPNHFKTAIRLSNLGEVFQEMGEIEVARKNYQRALQIFQQFLGPGHHYTQRARQNLNSLSEES